MGTQTGPQQTGCLEPTGILDLGVDKDEPPDCRLRNTASFERISPRSAKPRQSLISHALNSLDQATSPGRVPILKRTSLSSNLSVSSAEAEDGSCETCCTTPGFDQSPSPKEDVSKSPIELVEPVSKPSPAQPPHRRQVSFACPPTSRQQPQTVSSTSTVKVEEPARRPTIRFACEVPPTSRNATKPVATASTESDCHVEVPLRKTTIKFATPKPRNDQISPSSIKSPLDTTTSPLINFGKKSSDRKPPAELDIWTSRATKGQATRLTVGDTLERENAVRKLSAHTLDVEEAELEAEIDEGGSEDDLEDDDLPNEGFESKPSNFSAKDTAIVTQRQQWLSYFDIELGNKNSFEDKNNTRSARDLPANVTWSRTASTSSSRNVQIPGDKSKLCDTDALLVCGTFDEDKDNEMLRIKQAAGELDHACCIPQDFDPSFPVSDTSDDEEDDEEADDDRQLDEDDDDDDDAVNEDGSVDADEDDEDELELDQDDLSTADSESNGEEGSEGDLHHSCSLSRSLRQLSVASIRTRCKSPVPKKAAQEARGRWHSPRPLCDRTLPRTLRSPPPTRFPRCSRASPIEPEGTAMRGIMVGLAPCGSKSLPRPAGILHNYRTGVGRVSSSHNRKAVDIVKGLEAKRKRRVEKCLQKHCAKARKGQLPEKKPIAPGKGALRMRELGLHIAGKLGPQYALSD